jgi:hypothetical protein
MSKPSRRHVAVLVLGMHRSGTSMLARVLNLLGCQLPRNLLGAHESNPTGHWESQDAIEINESLLAALGRRWDDVRDLPADWLTRPETDAAKQRIRSLVERDFGGSRLWVLKEPRLCRLAPAWLDVISGLGIDARVVVPVRDPREVSDSLARRNDLDAGRSHLMWWQHLVESERASRGVHRAMVDYEQLLADWRVSTARLASDLGIDWPNDDAETAAAIDRFVDPSLRHVAAPGDLRSAADLPAAVQRLYARLAEARGDEAWDAITEADAALHEGHELFAPAIDGLADVLDRTREHAAAVDGVLASGLVDRGNLVVDVDAVRLLREQTYDVASRIEQHGQLVVELVRQVEAQRTEAVDAETVRLLREQTYDVASRIEQNGQLIVELVRQVEAQRAEALDGETVRLLREQSGDVASRVEQNGQLIVDLVRQVQTQRDEAAREHSRREDMAAAGERRRIEAVVAAEARHRELAVSEAKLQAELAARSREIEDVLSRHQLALASLGQASELRDHEARASLARRDSAVAQLEELLTSTERQLAEATAERHARSADFAKVERALADAEAMRVLDQERYAITSEALASAARESQALRQALEIANHALARYEARLSHMREDALRVQAELDAARSELADALQVQQGSTLALAEGVRLYSQQLAAVERSLSWRLTAPLRALKGALRGR